MFGKSTADTDSPQTSRRVRALTHQLDEARDVHRLATDPMLGAVTADRFRLSVTRTMWFFLAVGLGFTTTGVHDFLAGHLAPSDPMWWGAWLAEPALAGILITLLRWEAAMLSHGVDVDHRAVTYLKRVLLVATLVANVWAALAPSHGGVSKGMVFFHVVIPTVVFLLAEVMPVIQQRCTLVRDQALASATVPPPAESIPNPPPALPRLPSETVAAPQLARSSRLKLPPDLTDRITTVVRQTRAEGREPTTDDIRRTVKVSDTMAAQILADLAVHNGHSLTP
jgi:hypothetical protein